MSINEHDPEGTQHVGERVREARRQAALTQEEVAEKAGVSSFALSRIETGHNRPRVTTLRKIAKALDIEDIKQLVNEGQREEWIADSLGSSAKKAKEETPPLADEKGYSFEERTTYELLQTVRDLSDQLPPALWRSKTAPEAPERHKAEKAARDIYLRLTALFLELQSRSAIERR